MKTTLVFSHGFGFDKSFWENLIPYFQDSNEYNIMVLDHGYFSDTVDTKQIYNFTSTKYIGIGHSLGLNKLLSLNVNYECLIGINCFVNFLGSDLTLKAQREKEFFLFKKSFEKNPKLTLQIFYNKCLIGALGKNATTESILKFRNDFKKKFIPDQKQINHKKLLSDIKFLPQIYEVQIPTLVINSNDDIIAPKNLTNENFSRAKNFHIVMLDNGGHIISHVFPEIIYETITNFVTKTRNQFEGKEKLQ
jgi:pimeloyl-[acyl-carrier protein] methyl ester esterase